MRPDREPWLIVHRAGASRRRLAAAQRSSADYLEIDVRTDGGRAESRHEALFHPPWPFLVRWQGLPRPRNPIGWRRPLGRVWLDRIEAPGRVFLDIKEGGGEGLGLIVEALEAGGSLAGAVASTPRWEQLDRLAELAPGIGRYYTMARSGDEGAAMWEAYRSRMGDEGRAGQGVSLQYRLATRERLQALAEAGLRAVCYTVNDYETGMRLLEAGAGGLTSDRLDLIARWRDQLGRRG